MDGGHAFSIKRIWVLIDKSSQPFEVTRVFGVDEELPRDAVPLYQGHQIASRLWPNTHTKDLHIKHIMKNKVITPPAVGVDIFRVMCGDSNQLGAKFCGKPAKSKTQWSWVTARLLQTKLHAVAKSSTLYEFQRRFCDEADSDCTVEDVTELGRVVIEDRPKPSFPLDMWEPRLFLQDLAREVTLAKHASDGRYIMLLALFIKYTSVRTSRNEIIERLKISTHTYGKVLALISEKGMAQLPDKVTHTRDGFCEDGETRISIALESWRQITLKSGPRCHLSSTSIEMGPQLMWRWCTLEA